MGVVTVKGLIVLSLIIMMQLLFTYLMFLNDYYKNSLLACNMLFVECMCIYVLYNTIHSPVQV